MVDDARRVRQAAMATNFGFPFPHTLALTYSAVPVETVVGETRGALPGGDIVAWAGHRLADRAEWERRVARIMNDTGWRKALPHAWLSDLVPRVPLDLRHWPSTIRDLVPAAPPQDRALSCTSESVREIVTHAAWCTVLEDRAARRRPAYGDAFIAPAAGPQFRAGFDLDGE